MFSNVYPYPHKALCLIVNLQGASKSKTKSPSAPPAERRRNPQQADVFLSASGDCTVKVWDVRQPRPTLSLAAHQFEVLSADWCKYNDCVIATGSVDKSIKIWDVRMPQREVATLLGHSYAVRRVAFHRAAPLLATASDDGTLHVFHARVFADDFGRNPLIVPVKILRGHAVVPRAGGVTDAAFHPTQPWLFSAGADGHIRLWHNVDG